MQIDGRKIGPGHKPYIVADISCNHMGSLEVARELIVLAKLDGADAIKPQLYTADELCAPGTIATDGPWKGRDMYELYKQYETPRDWYPILFADARREGLTMFCSVFSPDSVQYLKTLNCPAYKISTSDYRWNDLFKACDATNMPLMISVPYFREGGPQIQLLNTPGYPCDFAAADMAEFKNATGVYGFSTHVMDRRVFPMAVALGSSVIEVNLARSLRDQSPDITFSWSPGDLRGIVDDCNAAWEAMQPRLRKEPSMIRDNKTGLRTYA